MTPNEGDPPWLERAVLVYGARKSGTTLFQNLLDGGKELFVYPAELKIKFLSKYNGLTPIEFLQLSRIPKVRSHMLDLQGYELAWRHHPNVSLAISELVRKDVLQVFKCATWLAPAPRMWCAKEVGGRTRHVLSFWRQQFPNARLLLLIRDPAMVTRSVLRERRRRGEWVSVWNIVKQVYQPLSVLSSIRRMGHDPSVFVVCYEDLVVDTSATMRRVARFLEIEFGEFLTYPSVLGETVVVKTASRHQKSVFAIDAEWTEGLTKRELMVIHLTRYLVRLLPHFRIDYRAFRSEIVTQQKSV